MCNESNNNEKTLTGGDRQTCTVSSCKAKNRQNRRRYRYCAKRWFFIIIIEGRKNNNKNKNNIRNLKLD